MADIFIDPKKTYIYVRQSTLAQTVRNTESLARQYDLAGRARSLGWAEHQVVVVDDDLGRSGASAQGRKGFSDLVADVGLGKAGIVLSLECSRLARNNSDWYQLLDLCALTDTLIADGDGVYHPGSFNDRLVLGLKGTMSEALSGNRHKASQGYSRERTNFGSGTSSEPVVGPTRPDRPLPGQASELGKSGQMNTPQASYADIAVMPTRSCEFAAGLADGVGMSA